MKNIYKENSLHNIYHKPFWAEERINLSKSYMAKLRKFYGDFQSCEGITKCAVPLTFIIKHQERIVEIIDNEYNR